jgi:hypothetical protein
LGGTPALRNFGTAWTLILGIDCLMPDGSIKDLYGEKFTKETGENLSN